MCNVGCEVAGAAQHLARGWSGGAWARVRIVTGLRRGLGACVGSPWWLLVAGGLGELTKCQALVVDK